MHSPLFDTLTRAPLLTRGSAGRGTVRQSNVAAAKKKNKKGKKKDPNAVCKKQAQVWELFVNFSCDQNPDPDCLDFLDCAEPLETCDFTEFFDCFQDVSAP